MRAVTSRAVTKFLWEDMVCRHEIFGQLIVDGDLENKDIVDEFAKIYGISRVVISAYNAKANGMIERGHKPVINALAKMTAGGIDY